MGGVHRSRPYLQRCIYSCKQQKWNPPQFSSKIIRYYYKAEFVSVDHVVELVKGLSRLSWIWRQCLRPSNSEQEQLASHERRLPVPCACKEFDKHASRCWGGSVRLGCRQILFAYVCLICFLPWCLDPRWTSDTVRCLYVVLICFIYHS